MKHLILGLFIAFVSVSFAQVATVEVQGVEATRPQSPGDTGMALDESIGEVQIVIIAMDAGGNPVADAPVSWTVTNATEEAVYVVGSSAMMEDMAEDMMAEMDTELVIDGGVTNESGEAYLVVDSATAGDTRVFVTVDEVEGKTYDGRDMRVVWF